MDNKYTVTQTTKTIVLYIILVLAFLLFLGFMFGIAFTPHKLPSLYTQHSSKAQRGSIISADGFHLAITKKLYKAVVDTRYIDPDKKDLFVKLFHIYSNIPIVEIEKKLAKKRGSVVLSYNIEPIKANYLRQLSYQLNKHKVFMMLVNKRTGLKSLQGLNIIESGETRQYPYGKLLTPTIGYPHKIEEHGYTKIEGVKGLEAKFDFDLKSKQDGYSKGLRDVRGNIILNNLSDTKAKVNGSSVKLNIPVELQIRIEKMCDNMKVALEAKQVMIAIMDSHSGDMIVMATSNRFLPKKIKRSDYPSLRNSMTEYSFEPGSVMKVITFSLLLDKGLINPYELVNGHNGRFRIGRKIVKDEHKFKWLSAEDVIVYSSNVGISQLAQKLSGTEFYNGLLRFGFKKKSTYDLYSEQLGSIPNKRQLNNQLYKATCAYGYSIKVNLMQLIRAYSAFTNNGKIVYPKIVAEFIDIYGRHIDNILDEPIKVIKSSTATRMKKILIKTVERGTGKKAITQGLIIGGKTGTAHIVEKGKYVEKYNTSFIGFAQGKHRTYTIGVLVIKPELSQFASQTAVPVFKKAVDIMLGDNYLTKY